MKRKSQQRKNGAGLRKLSLISGMILFLSCSKQKKITYYPNSEVVHQDYYVELMTGKPVGIYKSYHPSGRLFSVEHYQAGVQDGEYKIYCDETEKLNEEGYYTNGVLNGTLTYYACNTNFSYSIKFKNGKFWNVDFVRFDNRELDHGTLINGEGILNKYSDHGRKTDVYIIQDGKKFGYRYRISNTGHIDSTLVVDKIDNLYY